MMGFHHIRTALERMGAITIIWRIFRDVSNDSKKAEERKKDLVKELTQFNEKPKCTLKLVKEKILATWLNQTFQSIWLSHSLIVNIHILTYYETYKTDAD